MNYTVKQFEDAEKVMNDYQLRAYKICELFHNKFPTEGVRDNLSDYDLSFQLLPDGMAHIGIDLGFEIYCSGDDEEAYCHVYFPFELMNMDDSEIEKNYKLVFYNDCAGTIYSYKIIKKENK